MLARMIYIGPFRVVRWLFSDGVGHKFPRERFELYVIIVKDGSFVNL